MDELQIVPTPENEPPKPEAGTPPAEPSAEAQNSAAPTPEPSMPAPGPGTPEPEQGAVPLEEKPSSSMEEQSTFTPKMEQPAGPKETSTPEPEATPEASPMEPVPQGIPAIPEPGVEAETAEEPKKGLPKAVIIGGVLLIVGIAAAAVYFGFSGQPFKGQVAAPDAGSPLRYAAAPQETCPVDYYYEPTIARTLMDSNLNDATTSRLVNYIPAARAQTRLPVANMEVIAQPATLDATYIAQPATLDATYMAEPATLNATYTAQPATDIIATDAINIVQPATDVIAVDSNAPIAVETATLQQTQETMIQALTATLQQTQETTATMQAKPVGADIYTGTLLTQETLQAKPVTPTFDASQCKPIPRDDCELVNRLLADPATYFLAADTITHLETWSRACREKAVPTCPTNAELDANQNCVCSAGYFELPSALTSSASTDAATAEVLSLASPVSDVATLAAPADNTVQGLRTLDGAAPTDMTVQGLRTLDTTTDMATLGTRTLASDGIKCVNCDELQKMIDSVNARLAALPTMDITADERTAQEKRYNDILGTLTQVAQKNGCVEKVTEVCVPKENEVVTDAGDCACKAGYVRNDASGACEFDCTSLVTRLTEIKNTPPAAITPEVQAEISDLEQQAARNACEVPKKELTACEQYSAAATDLVAAGNLRDSYSSQLSMIRESCTREFTTCEQRLANGTVAGAYMNTSRTDADRNYFLDQFNQERDAFYGDASCITIQDRCRKIEAATESGTQETSALTRIDAGATDTIRLTDTAPLNIITLTDTAPTRDAIAPDGTAFSSLSQDRLNSAIDLAIKNNGLLSDKEFYNMYCVTDNREVPPPVPFMGNGSYTQEREGDQPPVAPANAPPPPEEPPVTPPNIPVVSPAASPAEVVSATEPVISPISAVPSPEPETVAAESAAVSPEQVSAPPSPFISPVTSEETTLKPAASEEPPAMAEPPVVTAVTTTGEPMPPEITPTGPEVYFYLLGFVALQAYIFRRKIVDYVRAR